MFAGLIGIALAVVNLVCICRYFEAHQFWRKRIRNNNVQKNQRKIIRLTLLSSLLPTAIMVLVGCSFAFTALVLAIAYVGITAFASADLIGTIGCYSAVSPLPSDRLMNFYAAVKLRGAVLGLSTFCPIGYAFLALVDRITLLSAVALTVLVVTLINEWVLQRSANNETSCVQRLTSDNDWQRYVRT